MDYPRYETARLADVDDTCYFAAQCQFCLRSRRISLARLRAMLPDHFLVKDIRHRLKCTTCGSRAMTITFLAPNQAVGTLAELFRQPIAD